MPERIKFEDVKKAALGHNFSKMEMMSSCKAVFGGVAWPGKRPGFAVVVAMDSKRHFDSYDISLLDEFESVHTRELVRQCGVLDFKYSPERWIGDYKNDAADHFIREMNTDRKKQREKQGQKFVLNPTLILDMEHLYSYILDELKRLLDKERRQLILKSDSKILNYLSAIEPNNIYKLEFGDYPAIEALAFAVIESKSRIRDPEKLRRHRELKEKYFG